MLRGPSPFAMVCLAITLCIFVGPADGRPCRKVRWFTAIAGKNVNSYKLMLRAAVMSAKENAPSLLPHFLYNGPLDDPFLDWYSQHGVVIHHNLSFYSVLEEQVHRGKRPGGWLGKFAAYMWLDLGQIAASLPQQEGIESQYVLYTDVDVMFFEDISSCTAPPAPQVMHIGSEARAGEMRNSGVLFINVTRLAHDLPAIIATGQAMDWAYDQTLIKRHYGLDKLTHLADEWNHKPYWESKRRVCILHMHGPKPTEDLDCLVVSKILQRPSSACLEEMSPGNRHLATSSFARDGGRSYYNAMYLFQRFLAMSFSHKLAARARDGARRAQAAAQRTGGLSTAAAWRQEDGHKGEDDGGVGAAPMWILAAEGGATMPNDGSGDMPVVLVANEASSFASAASAAGGASAMEGAGAGAASGRGQGRGADAVVGTSEIKVMEVEEDGGGAAAGVPDNISAGGGGGGAFDAAVDRGGGGGVDNGQEVDSLDAADASQLDSVGPGATGEAGQPEGGLLGGGADLPQLGTTVDVDASHLTTAPEADAPKLGVVEEADWSMLNAAVNAVRPRLGMVGQRDTLPRTDADKTVNPSGISALEEAEPAELDPAAEELRLIKLGVVVDSTFPQTAAGATDP